MMDLVREGYGLATVAEGRHGGVDVVLARGDERTSLSFEHYEVPALMCTCVETGVAK